MSESEKLRRAIELTMSAGYQLDPEAFGLLSTLAATEDPSEIMVKIIKKLESTSEKPIFIDRPFLEQLLEEHTPTKEVVDLDISLERPQKLSEQQEVQMLVLRSASRKQPKGHTEGAIDFHIHSSPDVVERSVDDLAAAESSAKKGLRAIVLKNHVSSTAARAQTTNALSTGTVIFGGVVLNHAVSGINSYAVDAMVKMCLIMAGWYGSRRWMPGTTWLPLESREMA